MGNRSAILRGCSSLASPLEAGKILPLRPRRHLSSVQAVVQVPGEYKRWCVGSLAGQACHCISTDRVAT